MNNLSENKIKQLTLSFLKKHYRYRPRSGKTVVSSDMRGSGGIIADGYLSFEKEDGSNFVATFEATSYNTRNEVVFRIQNELLNWDSFAIASMSTAVLLGWSYVFKMNLLKPGYLLLNIAIALAILTCLLFTFRLLFRSFRRYRYIYAIEQFKKYHADEQWIAIAEDVFQSTEHPNYRELKNQCVYNGFGLIMVDFNGISHLQMTPTRQEMFARKRKVLRFFSLNEFGRKVQDKNYMGWFNKSGLKKVVKPGSLKKFKRSYSYQMFVSLISVLIISGIFFKKQEEKPFEVVSTQKYVEELSIKMKTNRREPRTYLLDSASVRPFNRKSSPYLVDVGESAPPKSVKPERDDPEILITSEGATAYDCERFYTFKTIKYIVQEDQYPDLERAEKRIAELKKAGLQANVLWLGCFSATEGDYAVYFNLLLNDRLEAGQELSKFRGLMERKNLGHNIAIRALLPQNN